MRRYGRIWPLYGRTRRARPVWGAGWTASWKSTRRWWESTLKPSRGASNWFLLLRPRKSRGGRRCADSRARICKRLWSPEIDSEESTPPSYVAWRVGTPNRVVVQARQAGNRFLGSLKGLQIPAQRSGRHITTTCTHHNNIWFVNNNSMTTYKDNNNLNAIIFLKKETFSRYFRWIFIRRFLCLYNLPYNPSKSVYLLALCRVLYPCQLIQSECSLFTFLTTLLHFLLSV